jgi:hypothetical protein
MSAAEKLDLAAAARRLAAAQVSLRERRRFRRAFISIHGRLLDGAGREHDCRTADISPGDARIATAMAPEVGERIVIYLDGFGRVSGRVARRCGEGEVAVIFDFTAYKREKLAEQLIIAMNKHIGVEPETRPAPSDNGSLVRIEFETGDTCMGEVLDFSLAGLTVKTDRRPPLIGVWVRVGGVYGRVARIIEGGFAVDFETVRHP